MNYTWTKELLLGPKDMEPWEELDREEGRRRSYRKYSASTLFTAEERKVHASSCTQGLKTENHDTRMPYP